MPDHVIEVLQYGSLGILAAVMVFFCWLGKRMTDAAIHTFEALRAAMEGIRLHMEKDTVRDERRIVQIQGMHTVTRDEVVRRLGGDVG